MARLPKVKRNSEFQEIFRTGKIWSNPAVVLYLVRSQQPASRIGICVSKKLGKATVRNRVKRLLHEACRQQWPQLKSGFDLILLARRGALDKPFAEVVRAVDDLFRRAHLLHRPEGSGRSPSQRTPSVATAAC